MRTAIKLGGSALTAALIVGCGGGGGNADGPASPVVTPGVAQNTVPLANAGAVQNVIAGTRVTLDGSASTDADGDALTYSWTLSAPSGSSAKLSSSNSPKPTFVADLPGSYDAALIVNDGKASSTKSVVAVTSTIANAAPVASAGPTQNVIAGSLVTLDGTASSDANGDQLSYDWILVSKPAGSTATLSAANSAKPSFTADKVGAYVASLGVFDGKVYSSAASATVNAVAANVPPVANAGAAQSVTLGTLVTLDGSASYDANADALSYRWTLTSKPSGSAAALDTPSSPKPSFKADVIGVYVATLTVNDGQASSAPATVPVAVAVANVAPVANAGPAQLILAGTVVTLDGTASSDANGDRITYLWTLVSKPAGSAAALSLANSPMPTFTADLSGTYVATLVVNDGKLDSAPMNVTVTASMVNMAPVANAGAAQSVTTGTVVTLDGSASSDANGDALSYQWTMTNKPTGSTAVLSSPSSIRPTFTADVLGTYVATLVVSDGRLSSAAATIPITAATTNAAPVANAGPAQSVVRGALVTLDGIGSTDANLDTLSYQWILTSRPAGSVAELSLPTSANPSFKADVAGVYVASLVVSDGKATSNWATVPISVSAPPP